MKIFVKTLKDTHFEMDVKPEDTVADVKKNIETLQGPHNCPAAKQLLIYKGNVLENDSTLQDNKVVENSFIVIVLTKPMLQELGKQNPQVVRLIQEHHAEFLRLVNEPIEGGEENIPGQFGRPMPQAIQVTPAEHEAIKRLEVMGFDTATVLEVYFACNKNEGLAANYLLDHLHEFED